MTTKKDDAESGASKSAIALLLDTSLVKKDAAPIMKMVKLGDGKKHPMFFAPATDADMQSYWAAMRADGEERLRGRIRFILATLREEDGSRPKDPRTNGVATFDTFKSLNGMAIAGIVNGALEATGFLNSKETEEELGND